MKLIIQSVGVALIAICMVMAVRYSVNYFNTSDNNSKVVVALKNLKDCNILQSECIFIIGSRKVRLKLLGKVQTMQPFNLVAQVYNFNSDIDTISVTFSMKSMMMGFNKFKLTKITNRHAEADPALESDAEQWQASILLPVCVSKRSDWQMLVRVETSAKNYEVDIPIQIY